MLRRWNHMKCVALTLMMVIGVIALGLSTCLAQEDVSRFKNQETYLSSNHVPSADKSWVFLDLPLGKYRFDTSVQIEPMEQNKVSPVENEKGLEQNTLFLHFSIKW
jgi:hypothetical protein